MVKLGISAPGGGINWWFGHEQERFNKIFLNPPYYTAALYIANFFGGGPDLLGLDADMSLFTLFDQYGIDALVALDNIDFTNDPANGQNDKQDADLRAHGYNTWQEALHETCRRLSKYSSVKYVGRYNEYSYYGPEYGRTPSPGHYAEWKSIVEAHPPLKAFWWGQTDSRGNPPAGADILVWGPLGFPHAAMKGILEADGKIYYKGTDCGTGREWAVERYPPYGIEMYQYLRWQCVNNRPAPETVGIASKTIGYDWGYWSPSMWYCDSDLDFIMRVTLDHLRDHPEIANCEWLFIGSGRMDDRIDQVKSEGGYCEKYHILQEGYRRRDILGDRIGPQLHPDIQTSILEHCRTYGVETRPIATGNIEVNIQGIKADETVTVKLRG